MIFVAIPIDRFYFKVNIEKRRPWTIVDEIILFCLANNQLTIEEISSEMNLSKQYIVASIHQMMKFRLVEISLEGDQALFCARQMGLDLIKSGGELPAIPKVYPKIIHLVIEKATGNSFLGREIKYYSKEKIEQVKNSARDVKVIELKIDQYPEATNSKIYNCIQEKALHFDENILGFDQSIFAHYKRNYMGVYVDEGEILNLPDNTSEEFLNILKDVSLSSSLEGKVSIHYQGDKPYCPNNLKVWNGTFEYRDIIIGGEEHLKCFEEIVSNAGSIVIIHSTFVNDENATEKVLPIIRSGCERGIDFEIMWGASHNGEPDEKNLKEAISFQNTISKDALLRKRVHISMQPSGSHAKLIIADMDNGQWIGVVGSCNWLFSPFKSTEVSIVIRHPRVLSELARILQSVISRNNILNKLATQLGTISSNLSETTYISGGFTMSLVTGAKHQEILRGASGLADQRLYLGSNRLGATARTGAIMPGEYASKRGVPDVKLLWSNPSGPVDKHDAVVICDDADMEVMRTSRRVAKLHGKFLLWDNDNLVVTSSNWASASDNDIYPWSEIGIHIQGPTIADHFISRLSQIYPEITEDEV